MRRISRREQLVLAHLQAARWNKSIRRAEKLQGIRLVEIEKARILPDVTVVPPERFNFSDNYAQTVTCLRRLKTLVVARRDTASSVFLDLSKITTISLAGALVLGAELHRWREISKRRMRARNLDQWDPGVRDKLADLGFFRLLNVAAPDVPEKEGIPAEVTVLPMISSSTLDRELLYELTIALEGAATILQQDPAIYAGLVEAAYNVTKHAYPEQHDWLFPPVIKGWWATAAWSPSDRCVKFLVYDQGVGIPETLPRWDGWEKVRSRVLSALEALVPPVASASGILMKDASRLIEAALEVDRTSLQGGHGKGLQDVIAVAQNITGAEVRILSGTGQVLYRSDGTKVLRDETLHLGGTLIEWTIPVGLPH